MTIAPVNSVTPAFIAELQANFDAVAAALATLALVVTASKTANYSILAADNYTDFDNNGAVGQVTLTLPVPTVGMAFGFAVMEAQNLVVRAPTGMVIYLGELASSVAGTISSNSVGSYVFLRCRSATEWLAQNSTGSWTPS